MNLCHNLKNSPNLCIPSVKHGFESIYFIFEIHVYIYLTASCTEAEYVRREKVETSRLPSHERLLLSFSCYVQSFFNPMDCSPPGSSVHEISQSRTLEWVAISFSRGASQLRDGTCISCLAGKFFTIEPPGKPQS